MDADFDADVATIIFLLCFCCDSSTLLVSLSQGKCGLPGASGKKFPARLLALRTLDVYFVSPTPAERHARVGGHPVPMALVPWIPAFAGMTRGPKYWQCIYEMDI